MFGQLLQELSLGLKKFDDKFKIINANDFKNFKMKLYLLTKSHPLHKQANPMDLACENRCK